MPNRIIRADVVFSDRYCKATKEARLVFFEILLAADDYGCLPLSDGFLTAHCPSLRDASSPASDDALRVLFDLDLLRPYAVDNHGFAFVPRFKNWPRSRQPRYPIPPDDIGGSEVKALIEKRKRRNGADAPQVHSKRTAHAAQMHRTRSADAVHLHSTVSADARRNRIPKTVDRRPKTEGLRKSLTSSDLAEDTRKSLTSSRLRKSQKKNIKNMSRASRMTATTAPASWIDFCNGKRPDLNAQETFENFRDYWTALPDNNKARKIDWFATWRVWCRRQEAPRKHAPELIDFAKLDAEIEAGSKR